MASSDDRGGWDGVCQRRPVAFACFLVVALAAELAAQVFGLNALAAFLGHN
jgi:hypothetical protein